MTKYKVHISIDGENFFWIIIENDNVINRNTTAEELAKIHTKARYYNKTNICPRCREENNITDKSILYPKNTRHDIDKEGKQTGEYVCIKHWSRNYNRYNLNSFNNIIKSLRGIRTGNIDQNCSTSKGDLTVDIVCELYDLEDLNKIYDNYVTPIDCRDRKTKELYQIQGRRYYHESWRFDCRKEFFKKFKSMICVCYNENRTRIEEIYEFPIDLILGQTSISVHPKESKYEKYRIKGDRREKDLEEINMILKRKLESRDKKLKL